MEYVEGQTLHNVIADEWPLGDARVVDIMSQVLSAIAVAHDMEVIHRDLKPDNIMILPATSDDGEATELVKVCDFGIATLGAVQRDGGRRPGGRPVGDHGRLADRHARSTCRPNRRAASTPIDAATSIRPGVILYHMLAGRPPFDGDSAYHVAMKHITDAPLPPSTHRGGRRRAGGGLPARAQQGARGSLRQRARDAVGVARGAGPLDAGRAARGGATACRSTRHRRPSRRGPSTIELIQSAGLGRAARRRRAVATALGVAAAAIVAVGFGGQVAAGVRARRRAPADRGRDAGPGAAPRTGAPCRPPWRPNRSRRRAGRGAPARGAAGARAADPRPRSGSRRPPGGKGSRTGTGTGHRAGGRPDARLRPAPARPPTTAPPPVAPVAPAPQRVDVERATASITGVTSTSAIPGSNIRAALARVPLVRCYRDALRAGGLASATATLRLRIDIGGYVTGATLQGAGIPPELKACVEKASDGDPR